MEIQDFLDVVGEVPGEGPGDGKGSREGKGGDRGVGDGTSLIEDEDADRIASKREKKAKGLRLVFTKKNYKLIMKKQELKQKQGL